MKKIILFLIKLSLISYICLKTILSQASTSTEAVAVETTTSTETTQVPERVPLDTSAYKCNDKITGFKIGDNMFLCVHFEERKYRIAFNVTVDNYEVLTISGAFLFVDKDNRAYQNFVFQAGNYTTPYPSRYYNKQEKNYIPLFNIVIKMNGGNITGVDWDNSCWSCGFEESCKTYENIKSLIYKDEFYNESVRIVNFIYIIILIF